MVINCKSQNTPYIQREGIVSNYLNEIRKYPILSKDDEKIFLKQTKSNNPTVRQQAIEKLVICNQRFVVSAAMKVTDGTDFLDLVNEGNLGLITAIERFDVDKDTKFITYAVWWVQKFINSYLTNNRNIVVPANADKLRVTLNKIRNEFFKKEERLPTSHEIQEILKREYKFNVDNIAELEPFQIVSLEYSNNEEEEQITENPIYSKATASNNIQDEMVNSDYKTIVTHLMKRLNERDRYIIKNIFGIDCDEKTYDSVADDLNLTKERVRQKVNEILKTLAKSINEITIFGNN